VSRTRYARGDEPRIAYELRGKLQWRRPWLVLIQGMGLDRSGWGPALRKLRRHFRLVLVDNRGSGRSGLPAASFDVADMAADVVAVLDEAGIRRAHVMGVSLGGMVAQELAVDHRERVDALVLVSTTPGWPFAYPMPAASLRLIAAAGSMTREVALRRHVENALSVRGGEPQPGLADRLVELQRSRPAAPGAWRAQAGAGARYAGLLRQTRSAHARWCCRAPLTPWSTRATGGCSPTASPAPSSWSSRTWATCSSGRSRMVSPTWSPRSCWPARRSISPHQRLRPEPRTAAGR
jgi:3-oxoadipate enol-lactonase